jgi:tripartite-type tricarboxylate transporter receptor subunit TctC
VQRLQSEVSKVLNSAALKSRVEFADSEIVASAPEAFEAYLASERARWAKLAKDTGIAAD